MQNELKNISPVRLYMKMYRLSRSCLIEYIVAIRATIFDPGLYSNNWLPALLKSVN